METIRLTKFDGGMNDCIDPALLGENQAQEITNATIVSGKLVSMRENLLPANPVDLESIGCYENGNRSVVKWYSRYYWTDNGFTPAYGGNVENFIGIPVAPIATVSSVTGGALTGKFKYCITYVSKNGFEGSPDRSEMWWKEIMLSAQKVSITAPVFPENIVKANVYRSIKDGMDFYYVGEIATSGGKLEDNLSDSDLLFRLPLETENYLPPPEGGRFITQCGGVFALAVEDKVYFSVPGEIHAWKPTNWIRINDKITGIAKEFSGFLIFTQNKTYRIIGADSELTLTLTELPSPQGCKSWKTIRYIGNFPVWVSLDGMCMWDGNNINIPSNRVVDVPKLLGIHSCVSDGCYFLFHSRGCLIYDLKSGGVFRSSLDYCNYAWNHDESDTLYMINGDYVYIFSGSNRTRKIRYRSPKLAGSSAQLKRWNRIIIDCGEATLTVLGNIKHDIKHPGGRGRYYIPYEMICENIEISILAAQKISEIIVEYGEFTL